MKTRPILFSGEMVRAILRAEHPKTQTRRVVKPWPPKIRLPRRVRADFPFACRPAQPGVYQPKSNPHGALAVETPDGSWLGVKPDEFEWISPYGVPGDRLWVRETFWQPVMTSLNEHGESTGDWAGGPSDILYDADSRGFELATDKHGRQVAKRPSIHMPRWASRITLEVLSVRVERVQDITITDADAEGRRRGDPADLVPACQDAEAEDWALARARGFSQQEIEAGESGGLLEVYWFRRLWDTINAKRGYSWESNPWVWVVEFKVC
jgi:hypothetical protein